MVTNDTLLRWHILSASVFYLLLNDKMRYLYVQFCMGPSAKGNPLYHFTKLRWTRSTVKSGLKLFAENTRSCLGAQFISFSIILKCKFTSGCSNHGVTRLKMKRTVRIGIKTSLALTPCFCLPTSKKPSSYCLEYWHNVGCN